MSELFLAIITIKATPFDDVMGLCIQNPPKWILVLIT